MLKTLLAAAREFSRISHSQSVITLHPATSSAWTFDSSRFLFFSNLARQNEECDLGSGKLQRGQLCQKHPCTKTASLCRPKVTSGRPGTPFRCNR